jgi:hypothetical protein
MNREDRFLFIHDEIQNRNLQEAFKRQVSKMKHQDHHRFKDTLERWEYAYEKLVRNI